MENKYINLAREIVLSEIDKKNISVVLFGSRATGNERHDSDIDIGFWGKCELENSLLIRISEKLEASIIPYHFDLIDLSKTNQAFKKQAIKDGVVWNKAMA
jgi:predicted nucleotidyltransferase